jgi:hypothetical protein
MTAALLRTDVQLNERRAEDMTGIEEFERDSRGYFARSVQMNRDEKLHENIHVALVIERLKEVLAVSSALFVYVFKVAFLEEARVSKKDVAKFHCGLPREHSPAESLTDELRQIAGVIDVGMRKNDVVNRFSVDWQIAVLFERFLAAALIETAVEKYTFPIGFDKMHRACGGVGCAVECYLHDVIIAQYEDICT